MEGGSVYLVTENNFFGLDIPAFPRVIVGWEEVTGGGGATARDGVEDDVYTSEEVRGS